MTLPRPLRPRKSPKQERSRALVDAILDAAARVLVASGGHERFAMNDVAELAGVSPGSLYQYFPHKESLLAALVERHADREVAFLEARFAELRPGALEEVVAAGVRATLAFRAQDPALHQALLDVIPVIGRYYDLRRRGVESAMRLRELLAPAYVAPPEGPTLGEVVFVISNAAHSLTHEGLLPRPPGMDDARLAREITRLLVAYLHRAVSEEARK